MDSQAKFQRLLEPGRLGKMEERNRIVMPPMGTGYADKVTLYTSLKLLG
jgi:2,4-dienoyl-CoA reductase-like NADH-dependent reductase (Old Yellow Enzyme family)